MHINLVKNINFVFYHEDPELENKIILDYLDENNEDKQFSIDLSSVSNDVHDGNLFIQEIAELHGVKSMIESIALRINENQD